MILDGAAAFWCVISGPPHLYLHSPSCSPILAFGLQVSHFRGRGGGNGRPRPKSKRALVEGAILEEIRVYSTRTEVVLDKKMKMLEKGRSAPSGLVQ